MENGVQRVIIISTVYHWSLEFIIIILINLQINAVIINDKIHTTIKNWFSFKQCLMYNDFDNIIDNLLYFKKMLHSGMK